MKTFLIKILLIIFIPLICLLGLYVISDPFKTLNPFNLREFSVVNRDYLSSELFLKNYSKEKYNSFIFGSSRGCGINTYLWRSYLPENAKQFLFQAWGESITGIYQKFQYLNNHDVDINNALILIDMPGSFDKIQESTTAIGLKHYKFSGKSELYFQYHLFKAFIKPSLIFESFRQLIVKPNYTIGFDTISNDWNIKNKENWNKIPAQDSTLNKAKFKERPAIEKMMPKVITADNKIIMNKIASILKAKKTNYKVIITPSYDQLKINNEDFKILQQVFGVENVYNFSGKNELTEDKYNFMDINHFDLVVGRKILMEIYHKPLITNHNQ